MKNLRKQITLNAKVETILRKLKNYIDRNIKDCKFLSCP